MPTSSPEQPAISIGRRLFNAAKKELPAFAAGFALGLVTGPIGFVAAYGAISGYTSAEDSGDSKFSKMVGLGVASTAATIGLGVAFGLVGVAIGATFTVVAASYINNGVAKVVASSVVEGVKGRFGRTRQAPAPSHVKAPPAPQRTHHQHSPDAPNPSLIARARHLAARARDTIAGRNRRETINPALERLKEEKERDEHRQQQ